MAKKRKINKLRNFENIQSKKKSNNQILVNKEDYNQVGSFYFDPDDTKEIKSFIKNVQRLVRSSEEYKRYISYLNSELELESDSFMGNITSESASLEFHHHPFTLYDIVEIIVNKHIMEDTDITSISIAEEVLKLHFDNLVGLVKLSATNHELVHEQKLFIPHDMIFGNVNEFVNIYYDYIYDDMIDKYNKLINIDESKTYVNDFKIN